MTIENKLSKNLVACLKQVQKKSLKKNKSQLVFFLVAIFNQKGSLFSDLLRQEKISLEKINRIFTNEKLLKIQQAQNHDFEKLNNLFIKAAILAKKKNHYFIGTEHCLAILMQNPPFILEHIFRIFKLKKENLIMQINSILKSNSKFPDMANYFNNNPESSFNNFEAGFSEPLQKSQNLVEQFTTELTDLELQKNINPIIKREKELQQLIQILCRKDKNNPIILGEPGVGKTALVEGLAQQIINQEVPGILLKKRILSLDLGSIVAGTMYRGDFENRLKQIMKEVKSNPDIILFIDELHNIMGAGSSSGTLDAANLLKPLLARGDLRCIGATTHDEYKKFIEKDGALDRRFQPVILNAPTAEQTLDILQGIKHNYENYHQVKFTNEALQKAVFLADKYLANKLMPDKAIDLIDEAAAQKKIQTFNSKELQEKIILEKKLLLLIQAKEKAILNEDFTSALKIKEKEKLLKEKITFLDKSFYPKEKFATVDSEDIYQVLAQKTKIPITVLKANDITYLSLIEKNLKKIILGQENIIAEITNHIKRVKLGINNSEKPLASFLFLGTSGVGKSYLAKNLALQLFNEKEAFIKIDMSEFSEKFNASKLIGAPAGYVGYQESNLLADAVKKRPYSLVLFDEIDKAHPEILNLFLQILEDGFLTDAGGRKIDFRQCLIIMTSNLGTDLLRNKKNIGFSNNSNQDAKEAVLSQIQKHFRKDFIDRLDKIIMFNDLTLTDYKNIIKLQLNKILPNLKKNNINLNLKTAQINNLAQQALEQNNGARGIDKILNNELEKLILN